MPRDSDPALGGADPSARQRLMKVCADATTAELDGALAALAPLPAIEVVRQPEIGLVMLQGRIGGDGQPFNVGEATVTRAVVRLATGELGFSYLLGRSHARARAAAIVDALGQTAAFAARLEAALVAPVSARLAAEKATRTAETAATRVQFFTLVRGED
ncbi:MAG: phosphonate C-P lyase system protein PhnG [Hyphomicrobiaceae bacterium]|nr:phosphonate C-P lyase system protein PhnG [Hyphomicrobiaceae bacterium]